MLGISSTFSSRSMIDYDHGGLFIQFTELDSYLSKHQVYKVCVEIFHKDLRIYRICKIMKGSTKIYLSEHKIVKRIEKRAKLDLKGAKLDLKYRIELNEGGHFDFDANLYCRDSELHSI